MESTYQRAKSSGKLENALETGLEMVLLGTFLAGATAISATRSLVQTAKHAYFHTLGISHQEHIDNYTICYREI
jgi:hypothetical protein